MLWPAPVPSRDPPRSLTMTLAPSLARLRAYSRPSPPPAPVTTMTRSCPPGIRFLSAMRNQGLGSAPASAGPVLEHSASHLERALRVRRVDKAGQVGPGRFGQHRLTVAELLETEFAVVGAHARSADATERQLGRGHLEREVVDQHAAGGHLLDDPFANGARLGEQIRRQRLGPRVDETYCVIQRLDGNYRQDRAEDFVLHQWPVRIGVDDDRRLDPDARRVNTAASGYLVLIAGKISADPVELALVDNANSVRFL